jgi:hypothetical protein
MVRVSVGRDSEASERLVDNRTGDKLKWDVTVD